VPDRPPLPPTPGGLVELDAGSRLDPAEAVRLRRAVAQLSGRHTLVGCGSTRSSPSTLPGSGLLLGLHRLARAKGAGLLVVGPSPRLLTALRRRGLHRVLVIEMLGAGAGLADDGAARPA
jgi:anti-anti-sigma regulatory factor